MIGAGPVGIVAALHLAQRGYRVDVFEERPDPRKIAPRRGRSINLALSTRGWHALRAVGAEDAILRAGLSLTGRLIHREDGSTAHHFYGPNGEALHSIRRDRLTALLIEQADATGGITLHFGRRLVGLDPSHGPDGQLEFERADAAEGTVVVESARVLVADGSHSTARELLMAQDGGESRQTYVGYWYKEIDVPSAEDGWALAPNTMHIWPRRSALLCMFPNADRSFSGPLFMPFEGDGNAFASLATQADLRALFEREFPEIAALAPKLGHRFFSRPASPIVSIRNSRWTWRGRYALIGDAAHTVTPVLGQGLNAGFEDCSVLDECLAACPDWSEALERYAARRRRDTGALITMAEQHFNELAVDAADATFVMRKRIENRLHQLYPQTFAPLHTLVTFHRIPYAEVPGVAAAQERLVTTLVALRDVEARWEHDEVQAPIREYMATARTFAR